MAARVVAVKLIAEVSSFVSPMKDAVKYTRQLDDEVTRLGRDSPQKFDQLAMAAAGAGVGLLAVAGAAVKLDSEFEKAMSGVSSATHATAADLGLLREAALEAGADTQFSATEAAQGITELAKAGVSTAAVLQGGLKGALDLAAAGQMEVAEAAEIAASGMTQFRLKGAQLPHVADLLAAGAGKAQGSVHDLGFALSQSGLVANQFGLSVEDAIGTLAAFASAGFTGSDAGTSFKTMLLHLAAPTEKTAALMQELGISAYDANGQFVGIVKLAGILQEKLSGLTQAERDFALAQIFGTDAIRGANVLYQQGAAGIQSWIRKVDDAGYAADTAARLTDNLSGDVERLTGSLETLAIESGGGANDGMRKLVQAADALVDQVSLLPTGLQQTTVLLAGVGGASLLALAAFLKARQKSAELVETLSEMGPAGQTAGRGLEFVTRWGGRAVAVFGALEVASAVTAAFTHDLNPQIGALARGLEEYAKNGQLAGEAARVLGERGQNLNDIFQTIDAGFWTDLGNGIAGFVEGIVPGASSADSSLSRIKERIDAIDTGLTQLVSSGRTAEAAAAFDRLADEGAKHGISVDELRRALPKYSATLDDMASSAEESATAQQQTAEAAQEVTESFQDAFTAADGLREAFDKLNGAALDADDALSELEKAYDDATESVKENGRTLDIHTPKGRANRDALKDIARAAGDLLVAMKDNKAPVDEVRAKYEEARRKFIDVAIAMGQSRLEATKLADEWLKMPDNVVTPVSAPGLQEAMTRATKVEELLNRLNGSHTEARVTLLIQELHRESAREYRRRWGGITEHAQTGLLRESVLAAAASPARYAYAEPATGGELFAPRNGNMDLTRRNVSYAVENWWGGWGNFVPQQPAQAAPAAFDVRVYVGDRELTDIVSVVVSEANRGTARRVSSRTGGRR